MAIKEVGGLATGTDMKKPNIFGVRHVQALLVFFGMAISYFMRVNISAAIVPMTLPDNGAEQYDWGSSTKSLILSSFFWGYVIIQLPAGILARLYGAKIVYGTAMMFGGVITVLNPLAAKYGGWQLLCAARALIGFTQGVCYPCTHHVIAMWAPITERSFLGTFIYSGAQFGTVIILAMGGSIFESNLHWPGLFYLAGGFGFLWGVVFLIFGCDTPSKSKCISSAEREYIESLTGADTHETPKKIPWKHILTSLPMYGLLAAHASFAWGYYTLLTNIPTYLSGVLKLNLKSNALISALPYFAMWICCLVISPISDLIINKNFLQRVTARKIFNTIGQWVPMACLIVLGYVTKDQSTLAIVLLTIGVGFNAACYCGYLVNHMDLSPNFAGPMMGLTNGLSTICSIVAPLVVGAVVVDDTDVHQWRTVFFITAGLYLLGNGLFLIFARSSVQHWNSLHSEKEEAIDKNTQPQPPTTLQTNK